MLLVAALSVAASATGCGDEESSATGASATTGLPTTGSGGSGAAGGAGGSPCVMACDPMSPPVQSGEFPADVDAVLDNCRRCHSPTPSITSPAPFALDRYACSQDIYFNKVVWLRMREVAVDSDFMPLAEPKLTPAERKVLDDWTCACAPPEPESVSDGECIPLGAGGEGGGGGGGGGTGG